MISADCLDVSGVKLAFVLFSQWLPDMVPTGLMMHLMWSPGGAQRPASLKSLRLSKIIDRSRVPISGTRTQTTSKGRRSHNPEIRTARLSKRASLREGLLQAASMESADFESKHRHGNHIIRSDSHELFRSTSVNSSVSSQGFLGSSILHIPVDRETQPLHGAADFFSNATLSFRVFVLTHTFLRALLLIQTARTNL